MSETEIIKPQVGNGRDENGRLLPGFTANPNGRPKKKTFRDYFSEEEEADLINKVKQVFGEKPEILRMAVEQIFGKPRQNIGLDAGEDGKQLIIQISQEVAKKNDVSISSPEPNSEGSPQV